MATESTEKSTEKSTNKSAKKSGEKSTSKKSGSPSQKSAESSKKSASKKSTSGGTRTRKASAPRAEAPPRPKALDLARSAGRQLGELTGQEVEGVTGLQRTDDGWTVTAQVVEVRRIPNTTDVLGTYEVELDEDGDLVGYRRLRRFARGTPGEE